VNLTPVASVSLGVLAVVISVGGLTTIFAWLMGGGLALVMAIGAAVATLALFVLLVWRGPIHELKDVKRARNDLIAEKEAKLAELRISSRTSFAQLVGGVLLIGTLAVTAYQANASREAADEARKAADRNLSLARDTQLTERFARAVDQLASRSNKGTAEVDVRVGALFSLRRIAQDSDRDLQVILHTVAHYIKQNARRKLSRSSEAPCNLQRAVPRRNLRPDVELAVRHILPLLASAWREQGGASQPPAPGLQSSNFRGMNLGRLKLEGLDISGSTFRDANIGLSTFVGVKAFNVGFQNACLLGVDFSDPRNDFRAADLRGADLENAKLPAEFFKEVGAEKNCLYRSPMTIDGESENETRLSPPCTISFKIEGRNTTLPAASRSGECRQGRYLMRILPVWGAPNDEEFADLCVTESRSEVLKSGRRRIVQRVREIDFLADEGEIVSEQRQIFVFSRNRRRATVSISGTIVDGTAHYPNAAGTLSGSGSVRDGTARFSVSVHISPRHR
jgi:uncharacterized protein YjbI with pentapeptide repeats